MQRGTKIVGLGSCKFLARITGHRQYTPLPSRKQSRSARPLRQASGRVVACSSTTPPGADVEDTPTAKGRHAVLHDFCMIIPYSGLIAVAGLLSIPFGNGWKGVQLALVGLVELFLTIQSLKKWRSGISHQPFTAATLGIAGALTWQFWGTAQQKIAYWPNLLLAIVSSAAALFLAYNLVAGGNPPRGENAETSSDSQEAEAPVEASAIGTSS